LTPVRGANAGPDDGGQKGSLRKIDALKDSRYSPSMKSPHFDNSFSQLPSFLFEQVTPTPLLGAELKHVTDLKRDLDLAHLTDPELLSWLNGEGQLAGEQRIATRYAGHQFGVWAGQLGDGRAISLGEILTERWGRMEIQTKGSGLTPFSRMGDGKAVIRSSVREYLCSEAMHGLGIPTTRVLALVTGIDPVYRESVERSALVARVFPTNLRFGHFELCYHFNRPAELESLIEYTRATFFNHASTEVMLQEIVDRTARLMASWMGVGFSHGVMNTDNMSILGLTLDYGPFGFMEDMNLHFICNHSDHHGRYAFSQQPSVAMWNLERLLVCFMNIVPKEKLQNTLNTYPVSFEKEFLQVARQKLGLAVEEAQDRDLFSKLWVMMNTLNLDFTFFFRTLCRYEKKRPESLGPVWDYYGQREEIKEWLALYDERLNLESQPETDRHHLMLQANPKYVLKNYIAQEVIEDVERGEKGKLQEWLEVLYRPFDEHPEYEAYAGPTPAEHKHYVVSCSS
jgi:serine/tyrosine/threonine adenylyltransferase